MPLHLAVLNMLRDDDAAHIGRVFPWRNRAALYRQLRPLCREAGVAFTPHCARHSFATWLGADGASTKEIMEAGSWRDYRTVLRLASTKSACARRSIGSSSSANGAQIIGTAMNSMADTDLSNLVHRPCPASSRQKQPPETAIKKDRWPHDKPMACRGCHDEVLNALVQTRRNMWAALKLLRKLKKKYGLAPDNLVNDDL
jgi:hypothetical protein